MTTKNLKTENLETENLTRFFAKQKCGCCWVEMFFKNDDAAAKAADDLWNSNSDVVVDDTGKTYSGVDMFYTFVKDVDDCGRKLWLDFGLNSILQLE